MKRARPPLPSRALRSSDSLLTTGDVARLLRVHPKHVYRLLRRGLPGHRVGGEWRFRAGEVLGWSSDGATVGEESAAAQAPEATTALVAANGDLAIEHLLARLTASGRPLFGFVQADRGRALALLERGEVLAAGCHGSEIPGAIDRGRLAFLHLVDREVGLAVRRGVKLRSLRQLARLRLASRPASAGVRSHFDEALLRAGVDPDATHARATVMPSHRDVVCAVARGEADVGLASRAWAQRVGLECVPLCREAYGLLVPATLLGDPRVVRLCAEAQSAAFLREMAAVGGYQTRRTGALTYEPPSGPRSPVRP
jgi:putative molybdopterin biosynthesis protein